MNKSLFILFLVSICYANNNLKQGELHASNIEPPTIPQPQPPIVVIYGGFTVVAIEQNGFGSSIDNRRIQLIGIPGRGPGTLVIRNNNDYPIHVSHLNIPPGVIVHTIGEIILDNSVFTGCRDYFIINGNNHPPPPPSSAALISIGSNSILDGSKNNGGMIIHLPKTAVNGQHLDETDVPNISCPGCVFHNVSIEQNGKITKCNPNVEGYCEPLK